MSCFLRGRNCYTPFVPNSSAHFVELQYQCMRSRMSFGSLYPSTNSVQIHVQSVSATHTPASHSRYGKIQVAEQPAGWPLE